MTDSGPPPEPMAKPPWSPGQRVAFRFGFSYLLLYILMNGNVTMFVAIPVAGPFIQGWLAAPGAALAAWFGRHCFHLTGIVARWHGGGSGDRALDYIRILCFLGIAVVATALWSALDWRRPQYPLLEGWLRFLLRLTVGTGMLAYGFAKVFPLQMREPSFAILNNTYGNSSPFTLLWTMIGLHPGYEIVCGSAEVAGGLLILYRRTATLGTLLSAAVMANVVLYNLFFDVPVKIYSIHLLVLCLYLLLPEFGALWRFFVSHQPAELTAEWVPPSSRRSFRITTIVVEYYYLAALSIGLAVVMTISWFFHVTASQPTPLMGAWQIDAVDTINPKARPVSPEGQPWVALYIDDQRQGFYRSADGQLWRCVFQYNRDKHQLTVTAPTIKAAYQWDLPDSDHLRLTRMADKQPVLISLHRLPAPEHYALIERGFRWVNEWGYER